MNPIYIKLSNISEELETNASRFWGNPALPENYPYPTYIDDEGDEFPYFFICQINLEEIAPFDKENLLPHKGLLSFFAKIDHYLDYMTATDCISGYISESDAVRVLYFPDIDNTREVVLIDDDNNPTAPEEMKISFSLRREKYDDEHVLFAHPTHREWETWDSPFEDWIILLQVDSFEGGDFNLNFMDCGVLDLLISPVDLKHRNFSDVRGIILST